MDLLIQHYFGAKNIVKEDVIDLIGKKKISSEDRYSIVKDVSFDEIATLSFLLQSAIHIGIYLGKEKVSKEIKDALQKITKNYDSKTLKLFLENSNTFAVRTHKESSSSIPSPDISSEVGDWFFNLVKKDSNKELDVQLKNPNIPIFALLFDEEIIISIDIIGFTLSKRPYKIALHSGSLNGVLAYTIARLSGLSKDNVVVDPFCGGGTIPIEVASYKEGISSFPFENKFSAFRMPILKNYFEKVSEEILNKEPGKEISTYGFDNMLKIIKGSQKNAKLSGVFNSIMFSKVDVEWIDSKFEQGEVDLIITNPPQISSRNKNPKQILKAYDDLFYQGKYLLNKKGVLAALLINSKDAKEIALKHGFKEEKSIPIQSGGQKYSLIIFKVK